MLIEWIMVLHLMIQHLLTDSWEFYFTLPRLNRNWPAGSHLISIIRRKMLKLSKPDINYFISIYVVCVGEKMIMRSLLVEQVKRPSWEISAAPVLLISFNLLIYSGWLKSDQINCRFAISNHALWRLRWWGRSVGSASIRPRDVYHRGVIILTCQWSGLDNNYVN